MRFASSMWARSQPTESFTISSGTRATRIRRRHVASSIDPWHEPTDIGPTAGEQVGLDLFYTSGYTRGLPAMIPIAMLYSTPEDAAAQIAYLKKREAIPSRGSRWAKSPTASSCCPKITARSTSSSRPRCTAVDPALKLGGPVFEGVNEDILVWPDAQRARRHGWAALSTI